MIKKEIIFFRKMFIVTEYAALIERNSNTKQVSHNINIIVFQCHCGDNLFNHVNTK